MSPKVIDGLRDFTSDDYGVLGKLFEAVIPEHPGLGEEIRQDDKHIKPPARYKRWLVEREGMIVAMADFHQHNRIFHPRKFFVEVNVHPDWRGRGLGRALYEFVLDDLAPSDPWLVRIESREDRDESTQLLKKYGYKTVQRWEEWRLELTSFDSAPFLGGARKVEESGLRIANLAELSSDPEWRRRFYELREPLLEDVSSVDARTPATFEQFEDRYFSNPNFLPEGVFIALDGDNWVALTEMSLSENPDALDIGLTAVKRDHRGRGIASAIKARVLEWACSTDRREAITWVEQENNPMLGINKRFGFRPRPAWLIWEKQIGEAPSNE
jgi:mycothiol synthase